MTALQASQLMDPQTRPADPAASKRSSLFVFGHAQSRDAYLRQCVSRFKG